MAQRLIEIFLPGDRSDQVKKLFEDRPSTDFWYDRISGGMMIVRVLMPSEETEEMVDLLSAEFSDTDGFRLILLPIEASLPRPEQPEETETQEEPPEEEPPKKKVQRISREELYEDIAETTKLSRVYIALIVLSSIVATIGILQNNVAVIIGAMVIAPLLGPNVAMSFATTIGDTNLFRNSLKVNVIGIALAFVLSVAVGVIFSVDPTIPEIASRTRIGPGDIVLALASGSAGALAFTMGLPTALVGVMVAVALLPPLATFGLLVGSGQTSLAFGAMLLFIANVICVNLSGVTTFLAQRILPSSFLEAEKAKRATWRAIFFWLILLSILAVVISLSQTN